MTRNVFVYFVTQAYFPSEVNFWRLTLFFLCVPLYHMTASIIAKSHGILAVICMCLSSHKDWVSLSAGPYFSLLKFSAWSYFLVYKSHSSIFKWKTREDVNGSDQGYEGEPYPASEGLGKAWMDSSIYPLQPQCWVDTLRQGMGAGKFENSVTSLQGRITHFK